MSYEGPPASCRLTRATDQTGISSGALTPISFDVELYDTAGMHAPASPSRITIPSSGTYLVSASWTWIVTSGGAGNCRAGFLRLNGLAAQTIASIKGPPVGSGLATGQCLSAIAQLAAGTYLELVVQHDTGTAGVSVLGQATVPYSPWISVERLA